MDFIKNIKEHPESRYFRIFEFEKCYIITNPKVASRYVEFLFKNSNGICTSDITIVSEYDLETKIKKYVKTNFIYKQTYSDSIIKKHQNIFNIRENKKEVILLIREPEQKIISGLIQSLFLRILNEDILSGYIKAYSLYKQKPINYTFKLFKKYESLLSISLNKSGSVHHDLMDLMNNEMESDEVNFILDYFDYYFMLSYKDVIDDIHVSPSSENNLHFYNTIKYNNLIDLTKFKIIDISELKNHSEYLISLGFDISIVSKSAYSNKNIYSLADRFFANRENEELKLHFTNMLKSERVFYDSLRLKKEYISNI